MKVRKAAFHEKNLTGGLSARNEEATQLSVCPSVCLSGLKQRKQMVAHKTLLKRKKEKKNAGKRGKNQTFMHSRIKRGVVRALLN